MPGAARRLALVSALAATAGLLSACSDDDGDPDEPGGSAASAGGSGAGGGSGDDPESALTLADLLARFGDADEVAPQVDFSLDAQLRELIDPDATFSEDPWAQSHNAGAPDLFSLGPDELDEYSIDLDTTEAAITVGIPPAKVGLLIGGQDAAAITAAAVAAGWADEGGVLTTNLDPDQPLSIPVPQLRPTGADLVFGGRDGDLSVVGASGPTLADRPDLAALAACLDDSVSGTIAVVDGIPVAVGASPDADDPEQPRSIICVAADSADAAEKLRADMQEAVESGTSVQSGMTYSDYLADPESEVLDGDVPVAKLVAVNTDGRPAYLVQQMMANLDIPGLPAAEPGVTPTPTD